MSAVEEFLKAPSERVFATLTKDQLLSVADHYQLELTIPKSSRKDQLFEFIHSSLVERQVLSVGETSKEEQVLDTLSGANPTITQSLDTSTSSSMQSLTASQLTFEQQRALLQMQLEHKKLEAQEREKDRLLEIERLKHNELLELEKLKQQELEREIQSKRLDLIAEGKISASGSGGGLSQHSGLSGMIKFLPKFNERDPDVFFSLFENVASDRNWSDEDKTLLLQTVLVGKAQEAFVALPPAERKIYRRVKDDLISQKSGA